MGVYAVTATYCTDNRSHGSGGDVRRSPHPSKEAMHVLPVIILVGETAMLYSRF